MGDSGNGAHASLPRRRRLAQRLVLLVAGLLAVSACSGSAAKAPSGTSSTPRLTAAEPQTAPAPSAVPPGAVIRVGDTPEGVVVDPALNVAAVALRRPDGVALVDLTGSHGVRVIATPGRARHLRLAGAGGPLLLPGEDTNTVAEIALPSGKVLRSFPTERQPHDAVQVDGRIWVTDELAGAVTQLGAGGVTLPSGLQPGGLAAAAGRIAVADVRGNMLYVFDATSRRQLARLPAGAGPTHVVQVGASTVAVADTRGGAVLLYDLAGSPRLLSRLPLAGGPYGLAADLAHHRLWVALSGRNTVVGVAVGAAALTRSGATLRTVQQPNSLAVDATGRVLVIAGAIQQGVVQVVPAP